MIKLTKHFHSLGLVYMTCFLWVELIFRVLNQSTFNNIALIRSLLFALSTAFLIYTMSLFLHRTFQFILLNLSLLMLSILGFSQISYKAYMNANYSFGLFFSMLPRIEDYALDFIQYLKPTSFILFIPFFVFIYFCTRIRKQARKPLHGLRFALLGLTILLTHTSAILTLKWRGTESSVIELTELYQNPYIPELALVQLGLSQFIQQDLKSLVFKKPVPIPEVPLEVTPSEPVVVVPSFERVIDDTVWTALMMSETNETLKGIDAYLMRRPLTQKNEFTGLFKDKNLIYIMVEAFDFMAIDEVLTPTLYKLTQDGFYFDHFYSPQYSCATGESEFIGLTSLVPRTGICSPNTYTQNTYTSSIFNLFNAAGYFSTSYHNYSDKFYDRTLLHENLGSLKFYNNDDLAIKTLKGWPSDVNLMEEAYQIYGQQARYFSYIITSSTHFPYDVDSTLGNRYLEEVSVLYPDMPLNIQRYKSKAMELDLAIQTLMEQLTQDGTLKDTVLILYGDHFPLKTERDEILTYGDPNFDRDIGFNINTLPMIIYNSEVQGQRLSTVGSTFDLVPTIANLFDLDYDPRLYFGVDLFDNSQMRVVPYASLSWNTDLGYYSVSRGRFTPYDSNNTLTPEEIQEISQRVKEQSDISYQILIQDYFKVR